MKNIFQIFIAGLVSIIAFISCDKVDELPFYKNGTAPVLTSSKTTIAAPASDSNNAVIKFSWTNPEYSADSANSKYVIQIDKTGNNFANPYEKVIYGQLDTTYTGRELNDILLANGFNFGVSYDMDVRVLSSYKNNNEQYISNTLVIKMTPYKIPPKVALPPTDALYIIGGATDGGWTGGTVPVPSQQLARINETTYAGVFKLKPNDEFLILVENGTYNYKFAVEDNTVAGIAQGGKFGYYADTLRTVYNSNFKTPSTGGWYRIVLDFQSGNFKIEPFNGELPNNIYIIGSATPRGPGDEGWGNPVPVPSHQFTRLNSSVFELTIPLHGGKEYLLLPENGSWDHKYAINDNSLAGAEFSGDFGYDLGQNFKSQSETATYKITVNFAETPLTGNNNSGRYTVVKQ
ncbi:MAG: SusE domain-containing protein [Bacteroidota bacterium]